MPVPMPLPEIKPYGENAIEVKGLTFQYRKDNDTNTVLRDLNLNLTTGSRCLLIGANGSGKSTLLRILAGRHLTQTPVTVLGLHAFHDTKLNFHRAYLDCDWGMQTVSFVGAAVPLMADIAVRNMMEKLQNAYPDRRDELLELLGIDLDWRMHEVSDGQRRRVQIFLGLVRPFKILLLDEVTTSLDVCVRQDLLRWLLKESNDKGATILYATHIFDGLDEWPTHLFYLNNTGQCGWQGKLHDMEFYETLKQQNHPCKLLAMAEFWLRKELDENRKRRRFEKAAGPRAFETDILDRSQGGYASGRAETDQERTERLIRHGRLSDMGNKGIMQKTRRVAN